jgi:hypothetical protein
MDAPAERRRGKQEPRGFLPRPWAAGPRPWRRFLDWLLGDSDDIDQQGLLAERTLVPQGSRDRERPGGGPLAGPPAGDER